MPGRVIRAISGRWRLVGRILHLGGAKSSSERASGLPPRQGAQQTDLGGRRVKPVNPPIGACSNLPWKRHRTPYRRSCAGTNRTFCQGVTAAKWRRNLKRLSWTSQPRRRQPMPRCPLCGSAHIVVTFRPQRRGQCFGCDLEWGLDSPGTPAVARQAPPPNEAPANEVPA